MADNEPALIDLIESDLDAWRAIWTDGDRERRDTTPGSSGSPNRRRSGWLRAVGRFWMAAGLRATIIYRLSHALHRRRVKGLPQALSTLNLTLHGFDVPAFVEIGPGLYVPHPVGTVVTAERIGRNLTLVSGVTIGMRNEWTFPTIGDNVYIGAGARVLGGIKIGDDVSIGANAVVISDVPDCSIAVGIPARVCPKSSAATGARGGTQSP
jgi:serine O-acetyltransferase